MGQKISNGRGSYTLLLSGGGNEAPLPLAESSAKSEPVLKLSFREDYGSYSFELEDLLGAPADFLGRGSFGSSYKADMEKIGLTVVVKRLRTVEGPAITEFENKIEEISGIRHENVASPIAYFRSKEDQLLVYDHYVRGSMSSLLVDCEEGHPHPPMSWEDRLKMAIGAARGLAYIHEQRGGKLVHGNLKPSNIFLGSQGYGIVSDILFAYMTERMRPGQQPPMTKNKYQAPEVVVASAEEGKSNGRWRSQESDVYSFGVLLLELLVRKFEPATSDGDVGDLVRWGELVREDVESGQAFDASLRSEATGIVKQVLREAFVIGMECVRRLPEERPKMRDVAKRLEGIRSA